MNLRYLNTNIVRKRVFMVLILAAIILVLISNFLNLEPKICYNIEFHDNLNLPPYHQNKLLKSHEYNNIFFHETSCSLDGVIKLNARQACAIESTAFMNPHRNVFVMFTSQVGFRNQSRLPLIDVLSSYKNVHFNYLNLTHYAEHTPLENWIKKGTLFHSSYLNSHTSDILRYLSLWKYGGTYLDLDIVMLDSLDMQKPNFAGAESKNFVAVGIINLEDESGHEIADKCVRDLLKNFNGNDWGNNGPGVLTRVLHELCGTKDVLKMISGNICKNFHVLPIDSCYSIRWPEHQKFFKEEFLNETLDRLTDSIIAHVWNKHSSHTPLTKDSNVAYIHLAKKYCPKTLAASEVF